MANQDRKVLQMQHGTGIRKMGRAGACLAFASSILVFAGPAAASAQEINAGYYQNRNQFMVELTGDEEKDGGDRYGRAIAGLDFDADHERVCYFIQWDRLEGDVTAFHLHHAPRHHDGGHWIDFFNDEHFDGDRNTIADCVHASRHEIHEVLDHPSDFYLNLHTTAHKDGAVRGQLD